MTALKQVELGEKATDVCRKLGVSEATFYLWKKKYRGAGVSEVRRIKALEDENRRLKQLVADLSLDKQILQDVLSKKGLKPARKRKLAQSAQGRYGISERHSCRLFVLGRSTLRYEAHGQDDRALRMRIQELARTYVRYGYKRIHICLPSAKVGRIRAFGLPLLRASLRDVVDFKQVGPQETLWLIANNRLFRMAGS